MLVPCRILRFLILLSYHVNSNCLVERLLFGGRPLFVCGKGSVLKEELERS